MGGYPGVEAGAEDFSDLHTECCQGPPETWVPGPISPVITVAKNPLSATFLLRLPSLMHRRVGCKVAAPCRGDIARLLTRGRCCGTRRGR